MPQIANQAYNIIKATVGAVEYDAAVIAALMKAYQQGTIFDVIVDDGNGRIGRVVATSEDTYGIAHTSSVQEISTDYTLPKYEGLAAIQQAALAQGLEVNQIPHLFFGSFEGLNEIGASLDDSAGVAYPIVAYPIVDEDGNVYSASIESEIITAVQKTQEASQYSWEGTPITVPFEEVQKLIGLVITEY